MTPSFSLHEHKHKGKSLIRMGQDDALEGTWSYPELLLPQPLILSCMPLFTYTCLGKSFCFPYLPLQFYNKLLTSESTHIMLTYKIEEPKLYTSSKQNLNKYPCQICGYILRMVLEIEYIGQSIRTGLMFSHVVKLLSKNNLLMCTATNSVCREGFQPPSIITVI